MVASFTSCAVDDNLLDEDIASLYVGEWNWNDSEINKKNDIVSVHVKRISDTEIEIVNFHGIMNANFRVSDHQLTLVDSNDNLLTEVVSGESLYDYETIDFVYYYDNQKYKATMIKN